MCRASSGDRSSCAASMSRPTIAASLNSVVARVMLRPYHGLDGGVKEE